MCDLTKDKRIEELELAIEEERSYSKMLELERDLEISKKVEERLRIKTAKPIVDYTSRYSTSTGIMRNPPRSFFGISRTIV